MKSYLIELNEGYGLFRFRHDSKHLAEDEIEYLQYCNTANFRQEDIWAGDIILYETLTPESGIRISSDCVYMSRQVTN